MMFKDHETRWEGELKFSLERLSWSVDFGFWEKEDEEIRDFVKCHPMPSPDDEEGDKFWKKVQ
jgi:hypothetical protein